MKKILVFVCTGNICRSPMAEYMLRNTLKPDTGWEIISAGLAAGYGMPASRAAVKMLAEDGIDLTPHRSRPLTAEIVDNAALIIVMTTSHRDQIRMLYPDAMGKVFLLKSFGSQPGDISDPIGLTDLAYRRVHDEIEGALPGLTNFMKNLQT